jgi:hypothetical protein
MGVTFHLQGAEPGQAGILTLLDEPGLTFSDHSQLLTSLVERVAGGRRQGPARAFPWLWRAFDWDSGRSPGVADCAQPKDVLSAVQSLERDVQRSPKRHPPEWKFWVRQSDGSEVVEGSFLGLYRGKPCRFFSDKQGCWAVDTNSAQTYPVHYPLADLPEVHVAVDGRETSVRIERISPMAIHEQLLVDLKRVCIRAIERGVLLLPYHT